MLKGIFLVLVMWAIFYPLAMGLVYLGYGKAGMEARKILGRSSKGITLLWFLYLQVYAVLSGISGALSALDGSKIGLIILAGGSLPCLIWVVCMRRKVPKLVKEAQAYVQSCQQEEEAKRKAIREAKQAKVIAEKEKRERERALQESIERQKRSAQVDASEGLPAFLRAVSGYGKVADVRSAWNDWPKDGIDQLVRDEVQKCLDRLGNQEMIYGTSERRMNDLMKELRKLAGQ